MSFNGVVPGTFSLPQSIAIDPRDILYVADTNNFRVQRFGPDGTFAGEAKSTGTGISQGDSPGFVLGNMGQPELITVNSSSFAVMEREPENEDFFVHVFKTLPFFDVTNSSAKVRYVSDFNFQGVDNFTYRTDDGIAESNATPVDITVSRAFRAPERLRGECYADTALTTPIPCELDEDTNIIVRLVGFDPDGFVSTGGLDTLTFTVTTNPTRGDLDLLSTEDNAAVFRYTPTQHFNGIDNLSFNASDGNASAAEDVSVELVIRPVPDPVEVMFPNDLVAGRGFPQVVTADFFDPDQDPNFQPSLRELGWGDGVSTESPDWSGAGRQDLNGRSVTPQIDTGPGRGMLLGTHTYATTGTFTIDVLMQNAVSEGFGSTSAQGSIDVIEATRQSATLAVPTAGVIPDTDFPVQIQVTNELPQGWAGLSADNTSVTFERPPGLGLPVLDSRCSGTDTITCSLGDLPAGGTTTLDFTARIALADARAQQAYALNINVTDDGPKIGSSDVSSLGIQIADVDEDGVIDADDVFPNDPAYALDSDGDGLADAWEQSFGLDPLVADDPDSDLDGDGVTLLDEFTTGRSPFLTDFEVAAPGNVVSANNNTTDHFGIALAGTDLNQDGFADTVISAPLMNTSGGAFISYGSAQGAGPALLFADAPAGLTNFGQSVAVGDWDDNGMPDIAVAASNGISIYDNNGVIYATPDRVLDVLDTPTRLRIRLHNGDLDNDGIDDLLVVSTLGIVTTRFQFYLSTLGGLLAAPQEFTTTDVALGDSAVIADLDGDRLNDLAVGAESTNQGIVRGYLGADNNWTAAGGLNASFTLLPNPGIDRFGAAMAAGDITGDGIVELVVGAYDNRGSLNIYSSNSRYWESPAPQPAQVINGLNASHPTDAFGDQFGVAIAMGDLDRDGLADAAVGANRAGLNDEGQLVILRSNGTALIRVQAENGDGVGDLLGHAVTIPGDIDGDGVADVAAGAPDFASAQNPSPDGGYVQFFYHGFQSAIPADDNDNDNIANSFDNCPAEPNTNQMDLDDDGAGDVCDDDIDGDSVANAMDNCPVIDNPSQTDTDGDFNGDACDADDDNDGTEDQNDAFPLDARYVADADNDGMPDRYESENGLDAQDPSDADGDLDGDGRINVEEFRQGTRIDFDDVPPVLDVPIDIVIAASGPLTPVDLGVATATDVLDGTLTPAADSRGPYRPGRHQVTWQVSDQAGNVVTATQLVDVLPLVNFVGERQYGEEGDTIILTAQLNGDAVNYPVVIPLETSGTATDGADFALAAATIQIDAGRSGSVAVNLAADTTADDGEIVTIEMLAPSNAALGTTTTQTVEIVERNIAPTVDMTSEQLGEPRSTIVSADGDVTLQALVTDPNRGDNHSYDWSNTDPALVANEGNNAATFTFDPSGLAEGVYRVAVTVTDTGTPSAITTSTRLLRVLSAAPTLSSAADSDGDGIDDATEGLGDADNNGIPAYLDPFDSSQWLIGTMGQTDLVQVLDGHRLSLGTIALASGTDARVGFDDIAAWAVPGGADNAEDSTHNYPTGLFDFQIDGLLNDGDIVPVVMALPVAIPADALYRKYTPDGGWKNFAEDGNNRIASAPGVRGVCPAPGSDDYQPGLTAGHYCIELTIEDGGPNDADGLANRRVRDPGGVAIRATGLNVMAADMSVNNTTVSRGSNNVPLLRYRLNSNSQDIAVSALTLDATGSGNDATGVQRVRVWLDVNANGSVDASEPELGEGQFDDDDGTLTLSLNTPYLLPMGDTDFLVTYDF